MNTFAFGSPEVMHWAHFSGDFNPIHFDGDSARRAGLEDLVVHGMLALLTVKREIAAAQPAPTDASRPWLRFNALLRSPVPLGAACRLRLKPGRRGALDFRVSAEDPDVERFRGSFGPCAHPFSGSRWPGALSAVLRDEAQLLSAVGEVHDALEIRAIRELGAEDLGRFRHSYPEIRQGWIALDALVFADFMRHRLGEVARAAQVQLSALAGAPADCYFVQTSHAVCFDPLALGQADGLAPADGPLRCAMGRPEVLTSSGQVIGSVVLPVFHGERLIMQVELGLLARPRAPSH